MPGVPPWVLAPAGRLQARWTLRPDPSPEPWPLSPYAQGIAALTESEITNHYTSWQKI